MGMVTQWAICCQISDLRLTQDLFLSFELTKRQLSAFVKPLHWSMGCII